MRASGERGILLLPVALTLALVAALAYSMTQEGSMNVSAVDAAYEIERARFLAAGGVQLAKWRAGKGNCNETSARFGKVQFLDSVGAPLGSVTVNDTNWGGGKLTVNLTATTGKLERGTVQALLRTEQVVNLTEVKYATIIGPGDADTTIVKNNPASQTGQANAGTLTATDFAAHPLLVFKLPADLDRASIIQADMKIIKNSGAATQPLRSLAAHRLIRDWSAGSVTWTTPWANEGGDYADKATDSVVIDAVGTFNGAYTWNIASITQSWASYPASNYGLLLKPTGLTNVQFISFNGANKPELAIRYYKRCP